ncbi:MAG: ribonuclease P protein component [Candidatus Phytoplasma sp.]|nr:ribonuclease P protein component [Phytoplasma sp.]
MQLKYRIKKTSEIDAVFKKRNTVGNMFFVIYIKKQDEFNHFRFSLSIGKKYGKAHERNLIKRRIREVIRFYKEEISTDVEFVIVIKPKARELTFAEIKENLEKLMIRSKLIVRKEIEDEKL